jgi:hypothetical protein
MKQNKGIANSATEYIPNAYLDKRIQLPTYYGFYQFIVIENKTVSKDLDNEKKIEVLKEAVAGYKNTLEYNGLYISFLLDQISEEDFQKESEKYAIKLSNEQTDEIVEKIKLLLKVTNDHFTPSDISNIFSLDEDVAEKILMELDKSGLI